MKGTIIALMGMSALLLAVSPALGGEAKELRHGFVKAEKELLKDEMETVVTFQVPQQGETKARVRAERHWEQKVRSLKGKAVETASLSGKIKVVKFSMAIPERGSVDFDSSSTMARREAAMDPIAAGLYKLVGRSFKATVNSLGKSAKVSGLNKVVRALFSRVKSKVAITQGAAKTAQAVYGDEGWTAALAEFYIPLPKDASAPGATWKGTMMASVYPLGVVHVDVEYKFARLEDGVAVITISGKATKIDTRTAGLELPAKDDPTMGMFSQILKKLTIDSSTLTGEVRLHLETGKVQKASHTLDMNLHTEFALFGNTMKVPFTLKKTRKAERLEEKKEK